MKNGGYLLSHLRSTIGAAGLNFSVRDGKRWNPGAMAASMRLTWRPTKNGKGTYGKGKAPGN